MSRVLHKKSARSAAPAHRLRIVGGRWRGSRIEFPAIAAIRPTPDRVRETLFNWLQQHVVDSRCLDLFAGSGALGFEALSRGAAHVTFVDREKRITDHLNATLRRFRATNAEAVLSEAERFLARPAQAFDIVFLDPPFAADLLAPTFARLAGGWLAAGAFIYVECPAQVPLAALPQGWTVHRSKRAGQVGYHLLRAAVSA